MFIVVNVVKVSWFLSYFSVVIVVVSIVNSIVSVLIQVNTMVIVFVSWWMLIAMSLFVAQRRRVLGAAILMTPLCVLVKLYVLCVP